jgi:thiosulfate/3-mercaptopyruvate sulfurtransferase
MSALVDPATLSSLLYRPDIVIVDCRFDLQDPSWGESEYLASHVPGAVYAHLNRDLSGPENGRNGRHPLPDPPTFAATVGRLGIGAGIQVVAYDQGAGSYASRLWWMLRWMGHQDVAVLDGGYAAWLAEGRPTRSGVEATTKRPFTGQPNPELLVDVEVVGSVSRGAEPGRLIDARAPERFRGEAETIDRAAGHIPGAVNHYYLNSLDSAGRFLPPETLRENLLTAIGGASPKEVIAYCGSGVTACHNLLALEHAGLPGARLYPGSWSEWSSDPSRPIATGDDSK